MGEFSLSLSLFVGRRENLILTHVFHLVFFSASKIFFFSYLVNLFVCTEEKRKVYGLSFTIIVLLPLLLLLLLPPFLPLPLLLFPLLR